MLKPGELALPASHRIADPFWDFKFSRCSNSMIFKEARSFALFISIGLGIETPHTRKLEASEYLSRDTPPCLVQGHPDRCRTCAAETRCISLADRMLRICIPRAFNY